MTQPTSGIIPADQAGGAEPWQLPDIGSGGKRVTSAGKQRAQNPARQEVIEDVSDQPVAPLTMEQLQQIEASAREDGFQAGHKEGFAKGREEGQQQGLEEVRPKVQAQNEKLAELINTLMTPIEEQDTQLEQQLLNIVEALSRAVVQRELLTDSSHTLSLVQKAIAALPAGARHIKLYLNPDDLAQLETYAEEQQKDWQIIGDDNMLPGGCRIETLDSLVDFSVEQRLADVLAQFRDKQLASGDDIAETVSPVEDLPLSDASSDEFPDLPGGGPGDIES